MECDTGNTGSQVSALHNNSMECFNHSSRPQLQQACQAFDSTQSQQRYPTEVCECCLPLLPKVAQDLLAFAALLACKAGDLRC
jgi:hypothetical protein